MGNRLLVYQALWGMDRLVAPEASTAEKFDRVREAGFEGIAIDLGALTMEQAEATAPHFARTGLAGGLTALAVKVSLKKNRATEVVPNSSERRNPDVNEHDQQPQNSVA